VNRSKWAVLIVALTACGAGLAIAQANDDPADHSQDAAWHNQQMLALAKLKPADGWQTMDGGL